HFAEGAHNNCIEIMPGELLVSVEQGSRHPNRPGTLHITIWLVANMKSRAWRDVEVLQGRLKRAPIGLFVTHQGGGDDDVHMLGESHMQAELGDVAIRIRHDADDDPKVV